MESGLLISDNIEDLCTDNEGRVWMGSQEGYVFLYNQKSKTVEDYSDVFTTLTEGVQDMMMDKTGHLWISTNKRIIEYDPKTVKQKTPLRLVLTHICPKLSSASPVISL